MEEYESHYQEQYGSDKDAEVQEGGGCPFFENGNGGPFRPEVERTREKVKQLPETDADQASK